MKWTTARLRIELETETPPLAVDLSRIQTANCHVRVCVREAETSDIDCICSVNRESITELADQSYDADQISAWANAVDPELYPVDSGDTYFLVAEEGEQIIGIGWMTTEPDDYFHAPVDSEITGVYVAPDAVGRGVGTRLYNKLERFATERNVASLGLWASLNAISFYEKHGYERVTDQTLEYQDEIELPVLEMQKQLD